ncbi:DUF4342 domain-containing protein [Brassicibacter mesophilus]|uniref:DUF4342 domain-containing protein n=1 Tax=Brassicibacter mesophilus TaxID=745119 RepID=UPI003D194D7F
MQITLEQIDLLKKRANVGYREAKEALEKCNGDIVEALAYLEEQNRIKPEGGCIKNSSLLSKIKSIISKLNKINVIITKNDKTILNIPSTVGIVIAIIAMPFTIAAAIAALVLGCKVRLENHNGEGYDINNKIEKFTDTVNSVTKKVADEFKDS